MGDRADVIVGADGLPVSIDPSLAFVLMSPAPMVLGAVGNACLNPSLVSILSRKSGPHELGEVMGQNQGFTSLGRVAGPAAGGPLYAWGVDRLVHRGRRCDRHSGAGVRTTCARAIRRYTPSALAD
ncbi:MAG: hypothetical protein IPF41_08265 [Flavobacteriales bacterium]|nr:hypothetical protein [Flavobacteriales bacterium]